MCLPVSRLFWVSSLAYPNLLGTKGYVVVVVVVENFGWPSNFSAHQALAVEFFRAGSFQVPVACACIVYYLGMGQDGLQPSTVAW
jgi:hypothetical protein